jgi:hypothetical protein
MSMHCKSNLFDRTNGKKELNPTIEKEEKKRAKILNPTN